jgi:hypothetical protein
MWVVISQRVLKGDGRTLAMSAFTQAVSAGLIQGSLPRVNRPPRKGTALIWGATRWVGILLAFAFGVTGMLTAFSNRQKLAALDQRIKPLALTMSGFDDQVARVDELKGVVTHLAGPTDAQVELASRVTNLESDLRAISQKVDATTDEFKGRLSNSDARFKRVDEELAKMALRLNRAEESEHDPPPVARGMFRSSRAKTGLRQFAIIRLDGSAAWLSAPEGWIHASKGEKLPGGATVLGVGELNSRTAVFTDRGVITSNK